MYRHSAKPNFSLCRNFFQSTTNSQGSSENWSAVYKPRKGDEADTEKYPWIGTIKWKN